MRSRGSGSENSISTVVGVVYCRNTRMRIEIVDFDDLNARPSGEPHLNLCGCGMIHCHTDPHTNS